MENEKKMNRKYQLLSLSCGIAVVLTFVVYYVMAATGGWAYIFRGRWVSYSDTRVHLPGRPLTMEEPEFLKVVENDTLAQKLKKEVRVLCFVITHSQNLKTKAAAVKSTWAKRCNKYLFFSSISNPSFPVISFNIQEGRHFLTTKTFHAFNYIYTHHYNDADWFFKADDDTYAIMENLRYLLSHYDPSEPVHIGYHMKRYVKQGYMSGGGGYVLSKEALKRLVDKGTVNPVCRQFGGAEDVAVGACLEKLGIKVGLSLDLLDRETFHPFNVPTHLFGQYPEWYKKYAKYGVKKGLECCSDFSISFHYVEPVSMYIMDYLLYHMQVYGISKGIPSKSVFHIPPAAEPKDVKDAAKEVKTQKSTKLKSASVQREKID